jgi:hypothetical protein
MLSPLSLRAHEPGVRPAINWGTDHERSFIPSTCVAINIFTDVNKDNNRLYVGPYHPHNILMHTDLSAAPETETAQESYGDRLDQSQFSVPDAAQHQLPYPWTANISLHAVRTPAGAAAITVINQSAPSLDSGSRNTTNGGTNSMPSHPATPYHSLTDYPRKVRAWHVYKCHSRLPNEHLHLQCIYRINI